MILMNLKNTLWLISIASIIAFAISVLFCYPGIVLASGGNPKKSGEDRFLLPSIYLMYVASTCMIIWLLFVPLFKRGFMPMWAGFLSTVISFITIYPVCIMIAGYVYRPEIETQPAVETKGCEKKSDDIYFTPRDFLSKLPLAIELLPLFYMSGLGKPFVNQMSRRGWV
jgi:hypothetical protein